MTAARPYSLLKRLTAALAIVALLAFALVGGFLYDSLARELQRRDDIEIGEKLDQFLQQARNFGSTQVLVQHSVVFHEVLQSHPAIFLALSDRRGDMLVRHSIAPARELNSVGPGRHYQHTAYSCNPPTIGSSRCIYADETLPSGETIRILLAHVASERHSLLKSYQEDIWLAIAAGAILMGALGYAIARQGLSPVKTIGRQTSSIEAHRLNERLDIAAGPVELLEIATSVNRMLDRLERAFMRLSQFSSDLAHDMRTPLANVISSSQVTLSRTRTVEDYEILIESNIEECERLQRMIENMLFLARTDNSKQHLKLSEVDCQLELTRLTSYFQGIAEGAGVRFVINGDTRILADPLMFRRAVSNLLSNALDHATVGSDVELRTYQSEGYVIVEVTNKGQPIPPEYVEKIFDRFYRLNASRQGSAKNTGLGLAIVKSIMESHRGKVDVMSQRDNTTFALYFPRLA
ncbi:heavy metal sensor histidine kinase [Caballeronia sp. SEWSISQ10-4 2]|uniref:heavy metal sensor histidine kinase n=1 Tax=Caballeronia sp. SEWSISQ10-4 2 TaxID=2937438 RepID=UPI00264D07E7|nr:heavy metal sensor histidine kinase [Caballeronia sp. SEWSISQ10-4 2]MDN7182885.1 heavy metal sensor histidine kinase [Caballeronia sp. SEWSISQ10-4 2]